MGFLFGAFPVIFSIMFVLVIGIILVTLVKGAVQWGKNNASPVLTVDAIIVAKRTSVTGHIHGGAAAHHTASTSYYATFQVESGDRMELSIPTREFGMLAEGDCGKLTFQGTRYHSFARSN